MKQWFALTGRETILSQAELLRFVDDSATDFYRDIAISSAPQPNWQHLGGILRAGTIIAELPGRDLAAIASQIASSIPPATGKVRLGISWPHGSTQTLKKLAMTLKRLYRASTKQNLRLVLPASSPSLNSAHILHNQLLPTPHA
ncbi:hypothetical protein KBC99_03310, partial [Candidatus Saccharibacteria bacterium]|nr:hypothetical protein [Candidatus Saccharibacteria bacterium]